MLRIVERFTTMFAVSPASCEFGSCYREYISSAAEPVREKEDVCVSCGRGGQRAEEFDINKDAEAVR